MRRFSPRTQSSCSDISSMRSLPPAASTRPSSGMGRGRKEREEVKRKRRRKEEIFKESREGWRSHDFFHVCMPTIRNSI